MKINPPTDHQTRNSLIKLFFTIIFLVILAFIYGNWLKNIFPEWANVTLVFIVGIIIIRLYRLNKIWIFEWNKNKIKILTGSNLFLFTWINVWLNDDLVISKRLWKVNTINIEKNISFEGSELPIKLDIFKTKEWFKIGCVLLVNKQPLTSM